MRERIDRFENLIAWQKARAFALSVYVAAKGTKLMTDYVLWKQIWRAATSISSNIAEGFERGGRREFHQFLSIAKGSCAEVRTQLYLASDVGHLSSEVVKELIARGEEVARIIGGLRRAVAAQR